MTASPGALRASASAFSGLPGESAVHGSHPDFSWPPPPKPPPHLLGLLDFVRARTPSSFGHGHSVWSRRWARPCALSAQAQGLARWALLPVRPVLQTRKTGGGSSKITWLRRAGQVPNLLGPAWKGGEGGGAGPDPPSPVGGPHACSNKNKRGPWPDLTRSLWVPCGEGTVGHGMSVSVVRAPPQHLL